MAKKMNRPSAAYCPKPLPAPERQTAARDALLKMLQTDEQDYWRAVAANLLERWSANPRLPPLAPADSTDTNARPPKQLHADVART